MPETELKINLVIELLILIAIAYFYWVSHTNISKTLENLNTTLEKLDKNLVRSTRDTIDKMDDLHLEKLALKNQLLNAMREKEIATTNYSIQNDKAKKYRNLLNSNSMKEDSMDRTLRQMNFDSDPFDSYTGY